MPARPPQEDDGTLLARLGAPREEERFDDGAVGPAANCGAGRQP
jgi:hypothetical protein